MQTIAVMNKPKIPIPDITTAVSLIAAGGAHTLPSLARACGLDPASAEALYLARRLSKNRQVHVVKRGQIVCYASAERVREAYQAQLAARSDVAAGITT